MTPAQLFGMWLDDNDDDANFIVWINRFCRHCHKHRNHHVGKKCLYEPTSFQPMPSPTRKKILNAQLRRLGKVLEPSEAMESFDWHEEFEP